VQASSHTQFQFPKFWLTGHEKRTAGCHQRDERPRRIHCGHGQTESSHTHIHSAGPKSLSSNPQSRWLHQISQNVISKESWMTMKTLVNQMAHQEGCPWDRMPHAELRWCDPSRSVQNLRFRNPTTWLSHLLMTRLKWNSFKNWMRRRRRKKGNEEHEWITVRHRNYDWFFKQYPKHWTQDERRRVWWDCGGHWAQISQVVCGAEKMQSFNFRLCSRAIIDVCVSVFDSVSFFSPGNPINWAGGLPWGSTVHLLLQHRCLLLQIHHLDKKR